MLMVMMMIIMKMRENVRWSQSFASRRQKRKYMGYVTVCMLRMFAHFARMCVCAYALVYLRII